MADNGLITVASAHDFATTIDRLIGVLQNTGVTVFARIDHAGGAASVGLPLRPTTLFLFGNPAAGTPLMQAAQTAGIDLPLKALVWQDAGLGSESGPAVSALTAALNAFVGHATAAA